MKAEIEMGSEKVIDVQHRKKDVTSKEFPRASDQRELVRQIQKIRQEILDFIRILNAF